MKEMVHLCDVEQEDDLTSLQEPPSSDAVSHPFTPSDGMDTAGGCGTNYHKTITVMDRESAITCNSTQMLREKVQPATSE